MRTIADSNDSSSTHTHTTWNMREYLWIILENWILTFNTHEQRTRNRDREQSTHEIYMWDTITTTIHKTFREEIALHCIWICTSNWHTHTHSSPQSINANASLLHHANWTHRYKDDIWSLPFSLSLSSSISQGFKSTETGRIFEPRIIIISNRKIFFRI